MRFNRPNLSLNGFLRINSVFNYEEKIRSLKRKLERYMKIGGELMTGAKILECMLALSGEIREIRGEIEKLYEISGITYSDLPRVRKIKDLSNVVATLETLKREERAKINEYVRVRAFALEGVLKIKNPIYRQIIVFRYFDEKDWEAIALDMGYSVKHVQKVHRYALKDIDLKLASKCSEMLQIAPECSSKV